MKITPTEKSIGKILAYDTTLVTPRESSTLLKRGHRITALDVERLKNSGVYKVWIEDNNGRMVYEWEISKIIAETISDETTEVVQGRHGISFLVSRVPGLIKIDRNGIINFNLNGDVLVITRNENLAVGKGDVLAAIDVVPLGITKKKMKEVTSLTSTGMVSVRPFSLSRIGLVITGTEIFQERKKDEYHKIVKKKCDRYGWTLSYKEIVPDNMALERRAIENARKAGVDAIIVTGGMSVDPTDRTPDAIRSLGAKIISYGIPIKPTTMTLIAVWKGIPIMGISAGGIHYSEFNSIDVVFTRFMAGEIPSRTEIASLGVGGIFWSYNAPTVGSTKKDMKGE